MKIFSHSLPRRHWLLLGVSVSLLHACGFKLRGSAPLPFSQWYVTGTSSMANLLRRNLRAGTSAILVDRPEAAEAIVELGAEAQKKDILSLNAQGRAREYKLIQSVTLRVHDGKGQDYIAPTPLQQIREISFNDSEVLAKESEETLLYKDMQNDLVQQMMRRLANIKNNAAPNKSSAVSQ